jgi:hypothetical protein
MHVKFSFTCLLAGAVLTNLSACTAREWYESASAVAKDDCSRMQPGAREDCLSKVNKTPYEKYEKERTNPKN